MARIVNSAYGIVRVILDRPDECSKGRTLLASDPWAMGRNGTVKLVGLEVLASFSSNKVYVSPIHTRGLANAGMCMTPDAARQLGKALLRVTGGGAE